MPETTTAQSVDAYPKKRWFIFDNDVITVWISSAQFFSMTIFTKMIIHNFAVNEKVFDTSHQKRIILLLLKRRANVKNRRWIWFIFYKFDHIWCILNI